MAPAVWGARSNPTHRAHHRFPLLFACAAATSFRSRGGNPHALPDTGRYRIAAKPPNRRNSAAASVAPSRPCRKRQLSSFSETRRGPARQLDACELLTKEDLSQILNLNIERVESTGRSSHSTCRYYSSAAQQRASDEAAAAMKKLQEETKAGPSKADQSAVINDFGNMVRGIAGAGGPAVGETNGLLLTIGIDSENAKAAMAGFKLGVGLTGALVMKGADPEGKAMMREEVTGVGDEAISGPLLSLFMFRKGEVSVQLDARLLPGGRDAQIAIAKRIISKL